MMQKNSNSTGIFSGSDYRNSGGGRASLPGTSWLSRTSTPKPTQPPVPIQPPSPTQPSRPTQPQSRPTQPQQNAPFGMSGFTSPQGFAQMANMFKPVTGAVLGAGGMPALMGLYGMISGNSDWNTAMSGNPNYAGQSRLLQEPKTASVHFPLPIPNHSGRMCMPKLEKSAATWDDPPVDTSHTGTNIGDVQAPIDTGTSWDSLQSQDNTSHTNVPSMHMFMSGRSEPKQSVQPAPELPKPPSRFQHIAQRLVEDVPVYEGTRQGLRQAARRIGPRLGLTDISKVRGIRGGLAYETPVNIGTDLLDLAGIYDIDRSKAPEGNSHFWRTPKKDEYGNLSHDEYGDAKTEFGFNRNALGFNMDEFRRGTTADGNIIGDMRTGNSYIDNPASYLTASMRGATNPLKGVADLGFHAGWDWNPAVQAAWNPDELTGQAQLLMNKPLSGRKTSIPTTMRDYYGVSKPWLSGDRFRPGGQGFQSEADRFKSQDMYHPSYNREGTKHAPWAGQRFWDWMWNR